MPALRPAGIPEGRSPTRRRKEAPVPAGSSNEVSGERLALLYQLTRTFSSSLDLDEVLNTVMDEVIAACRAERGFLMLREPDGGLKFRAARGMDQETINDPQFQISRGVVEGVARGGEAVLTSDAMEDPRFRARQSVMSLGLRSILCAPLKFKDELLGAIYVDNRLHAGIFSQDDLNMLSAIASSAAIAIENARLYQVAVEKGRMERELQMARRVQSSLMPDEMPQLEGWEFAARWLPARVVAGDFYDAFALEGGQLALVIADVTDKGMPSALLMALTRSIVRASLEGAPSLAQAIAKANRLICADSKIGMPVSLFCARVSPHSPELTYVNAGHNPPLLWRPARGEVQELSRTGMVLGVDETTTYEESSTSLERGEVLLLYTDGVTDATDRTGQQFGLERTRGVFTAKPGAGATETLSRLTLAIERFAGAADPFDDITLVVARKV
jgi:serine phosphatase RsbU (regulator of sigma subunit)